MGRRPALEGRVYCLRAAQISGGTMETTRDEREGTPTAQTPTGPGQLWPPPKTQTSKPISAGTGTCAPPRVKQPVGTAAPHVELSSGLRADLGGGTGERAGGPGGKGCACIWLIRFAVVERKLAQHCKATIPPINLKKNKLKTVKVINTRLV